MEAIWNPIRGHGWLNPHHRLPFTSIRVKLDVSDGAWLTRWRIWWITPFICETQHDTLDRVISASIYFSLTALCAELCSHYDSCLLQTTLDRFLTFFRISLDFQSLQCYGQSNFIPCNQAHTPWVYLLPIVKFIHLGFTLLPIVRYTHCELILFPLVITSWVYPAPCSQLPTSFFYPLPCSQVQTSWVYFVSCQAQTSGVYPAPCDKVQTSWVRCEVFIYK